MPEAAEAPAGGRARRRRANAPLVVGGALVAMLAAWGAVGPAMAPHDPMERHIITRDESGEWHTSPLDPYELAGFPLGTDHDGRDILSRLLWAMRPTLLLAAATAGTWMAIGLATGSAAGWSTGRLGHAVDIATRAATAMPLVVLAIMLLYFLGEDRAQRDFVLALGITGWASVAELVAVRVRGIRAEPYIEAARSLGAGDAHILRRHVLPQLLPLVPVLLAFQIGAVLLVLGELGFLGFFVGGAETREIPDASSMGFFVKVIPGQPELAQMLGVGFENFYQTPWLSLWAGSAFFVAVFAFMVTGEGLRRVLDPSAAGQTERAGK